MIDGKEAEDYVTRLEENPKARSIKVKDVEVELTLSSVLVIAVVFVFINGYQGMKELMKPFWKALIRFAKWMYGAPEWEEEVIERMNATAECMENWIKRREEEERQEAEWDVITEQREVQERDQRWNEWADERLGRTQNVQVRTVKVQSQTSSLSGKFVVLPEREQGIDEEQHKEQVMNMRKETKRSTAVQTHTVYTYKNSTPRFKEGKTA